MINMADALALAKKNSEMLNALIKQTNKLAEIQGKASKSSEELKKSNKELVKSEIDLSDQIERRSAALNKSLEILKKQGKQFELLNIANFKLYRSAEIGGNMFDYFDLALASANENVKLMGIEAGTARRVLYGFFPPGMFSMVSKFSTLFKGAGSIVRLFSGSVNDADKKQNNLFTTMGKGLKLLGGYRKKMKDVSLAPAIGTALSPLTAGLIPTEAQEEKMKEKAAKKRIFNEQKDKAKANLKDKQDEVNRIRDLLKEEKNALQEIFNERKNAAKELSKIESSLRSEAIRKAEKAFIQAEVNKQKMAGENKGYERMVAFDKLRSVKDASLPSDYLNPANKAFAQMINNMEKALQESSSEFMDAAQLVKDSNKSQPQTEQEDRIGVVEELLDAALDEEKEAKKENKKFFKYIIMMEKLKAVYRKLRERYRKFREGKDGPIRELAKMFFFGILKVAAVIVASLIVLQAIMPTIKKVVGPVLEVLTFGLALLGEGFLTLFDGILGLYEAIMGGDIWDILTALRDIVLGLLMILGGVVTALLGTLLVFLGGLVVEFVGKAINWVKSLGNNIKSIGKLMGALLAITGMVIAAIYGAPVILIAGIGIVLYKFGKWIVSKIPGFANGGVSTGGLAVVGEKGPELVNLPAGSRVRSNAETKKMMGGSTTNNINITINARDTSDSELRRIADKIGNMVNTRINRTTSSATMR